MHSKNYEPVGAHLLYAGTVSDTTAKGILAYPGIETVMNETEVTYTDDSKTITSIATDRLSFVISATTNLFERQCIKLDGNVCVITDITGTTITVDRIIPTTVVATDAVTESAYYSVYDFSDKNHNGILGKYTKYFVIEVKGDGTEGRQDLVFLSKLNVADYYCDTNISTKPISMLKINASNTSTAIYYFKPF